MAWAVALAVPLGALQEASDVANLSTDAAGEDGADAWDSGQLRDGWISLEFCGDPGVDLLELTLKKAEDERR